MIKFKFVIPSRRAIHYEVNMDNSNRKNAQYDNGYVHKDSNTVNTPNIEVVNLDLFASNSDGFKDEKFHSRGEEIIAKENEMKKLNKNELRKQFIKLDSDILETENHDRNKMGQDESKLNVSDKYTNRPIMNIMTKIKAKDVTLGATEGEDKRDAKNDSIVISDKPNDRTRLNSLFGTDIQIISPFKISLIFCTIQISDVLLYNAFLLSLVLPKDFSGYELSILDVSIYLILFHLVYSLVIPVSNGLILANSKSINRILLNYRIVYIIAFIVSLAFLANYQLDYPFKLFLQVFSLILKSITMMGMLTSYNLLVIKIRNNRFKDKLTNYQNYIALITRALSGCLICFIFVYFNTQLCLILIIFAIFMSLIFLLNYYLFKKLYELIK
jgi:hypothetical protein